MFSRLHYLFVLLCAASFFSSCKKVDDAANEPVYPMRTETNVSYGSSILQKMDVYFPENYNERTPVVFLIHGGGFVAGVKEDFTNQAITFRNEGFVVVNLSHRLVDTSGLLQLPPIHQASNIKVSDELADIDVAVKKYQTMAAGWHSGTKKMYMAGHSAGAILSMLYVNGDYNLDGRIRASGNWAGLTDLSIPNDTLLNGVDARLIELYYRIAGAAPATANNLYFMAISPYWVAYKNGAKMPNISIYPEHNDIFNEPKISANAQVNTENFHTMLRNHGTPEKMTVYYGEDHGFGTINGSWDRLIKETAAFFKTL